MKHFIYTGIALLAGVIYVHGQQLYMPRNVQQAFQNETRSHDGKPGKNYWQNAAKYDISITVAPPDRTVKGTEKITYTNNSNDTLQTVVIRLIQNIHKAAAIRSNYASQEYITDGITIDNFLVNGQKQKWTDNPYNPTCPELKLPVPLAPKQSMELHIEWHYQASLQSGREGMIDSTTYYLAYSYPRVSVYDDYNGWDKINFNDMQEFYNDFNDYTFTVNAPKNFIVWATGILQNPDEVLQPKYLQRFKNSMTSDEIIHIANKNDLAEKNITIQKNMNTWKWKADNVPDVCLAVSDHFVWDASSVVVDDAAKRRVSAQAAYNDTAWDYHYMVEYVKHSLGWLSKKWPGVPYPYPAMTAFQGYADMEYPMMINDGATGDTVFTRFIAEHEIAHTWFPFYMGINESRYAFMDEGWATTFELLIGMEDLGTERAEGFFKDFRVSGWIGDPSEEEDLPIITPANVLTVHAYGNNAYGKPALGYLAVKDLLGDEVFKKALHTYMDRWHGKHPIPWDFFNSFNDASGKNLNWFWNNWYFTNGYIDFAISAAKKNTSGYEIHIKNIGGYAAPVNVIATYDDATTETFHQTPAIWADNQKSASVNIATKKKVKSVQLDGGIFMDADESNNSFDIK